MVTKMTRYCVFIFMFFASSLNAETQNHIIADMSFSDDTDNTETRRYLLGYKRLFTESEYMGVLAGTRKYRDGGLINKKNSFNETELIGRKNLSEETYLHGNVSFLNGGGWSPELYNLTLAHTPNTKWRIEGNINKEILDTASAITQHYTIETHGVSADYIINDQHTLVAELYQQSISDNNSREGRLLQYIHEPTWFEKGYFKLRAKHRTSDFDPPEYFAPENLKQYHVLIGYKTVIDQKENFQFRAELGKGKQYINSVSEDAEEYLVGLRGSLMSSTYIDTYYGCTSDGGADSYKYCYGRLIFNYLW